MGKINFFDAPSPVGDRATRREAITDYVGNIESEIYYLKEAVADNDERNAREHLESLRRWVVAITENFDEKNTPGPDVQERAVAALLRSRVRR